jgi:hypothetical protein
MTKSTVQRRYIGPALPWSKRWDKWHDWKRLETRFEALRILKEKAGPREHRRWEYRLKPSRKLVMA